MAELKIYNTRIHSFEVYGLNKFKNLLCAPVCDCGCGGKASLILENVHKLFGFGYNVLSEEECGCCAIFAHGLDGKMWAIVKLVNEENSDYDYDQAYDPNTCPIRFLGIDETDYDFFRELDADFGLHCYGLMIQNKDGNWDIVEE